MARKKLQKTLVGLLLFAALLAGRPTANAQPVNPFTRQVAAPEFPTGLPWLNTKKPLTLRQLRGKFVLLDFWTYCCINCMHVVPELKQLERQFDKQLVVVGVHSAKFKTERLTENVREAILRYDIEHPVVNDQQHQIWQRYGVDTWPTTVLIDPEGKVVYANKGEFKAADYAAMLQKAIAFYRRRGTLRESPTEYARIADQQPTRPLLFPGKVLADEQSDRLFIADSNHNRIVITSLDGRLKGIAGTGSIGDQDGGYAGCSFHHPQGMALNGDDLYVADTENHLIRRIDLAKRQVTTVAGTGERTQLGFPGARAGSRKKVWLGSARKTGLGSPWALWWKDDQLYIAMAGTHQIWRWDSKRNVVGPYAGNGREDIVDGGLLPAVPYQDGTSAFAQPSGLASDGKWLFVADSEGSSIRAVPLGSGGRVARKARVQTVIGTARLPRGRLFAFGQRDGSFAEAQLQHALGVTYHDRNLYVADTYNNKIRQLDLNQKQVTTLAGSGQAGKRDQPAEFNEPGGVSYAAGRLFIADTGNHAIRVIELESGEVSTLEIKGLRPPKPKKR